MSVPLPIELRERIVASILEGMSWADASELFRVGPATVNRLMRRYRERGSLEPDPHGGGYPHRIPEESLGILRELVEARPDATIEELRQAYGSRTRTTVSAATIGRALRDRLKMSRKKSRSSTPSRPKSGSSRLARRT